MTASLTPACAVVQRLLQLMASDLPLAALSFLLLTLYSALCALGCRYWRYLLKKNASRPPAEPRWTLALLDATTGFRHNLDLDGTDGQLDIAARTCCFGFSHSNHTPRARVRA